MSTSTDMLIRAPEQETRAFIDLEKQLFILSFFSFFNRF